MCPLCFRLPVPSRGRLLRDQRWSMATPRLPPLPRALMSGKTSLRNSRGNTRKCKYFLDKFRIDCLKRPPISGLLNRKSFRLTLIKRSAALEVKSTASNQKTMWVEQHPTAIMYFVAAIELYPWLIWFVLGPEIVLLSGPQKQNRKAIEALNDLEQKYVKVLKENSK